MLSAEGEKSEPKAAAKAQSDTDRLSRYTLPSAALIDQPIAHRERATSSLMLCRFSFSMMRPRCASTV